MLAQNAANKASGSTVSSFVHRYMQTLHVSVMRLIFFFFPEFPG